MLATMTGEIVDLDVNNWNMNGNSGIAYAAFLKAGARDEPQRVRITEAQHRACAIGASAEWPVKIVALESNYGGARLRVTLDPEFVVPSTPALVGAKSGSAHSKDDEPKF